MEIEELESPIISGSISFVISIVVTYMISIVEPTTDLQWALTAVGIASFFSGFFSAYFADR